MKKNLNEELKDIKYLFNYDRGRVISEQKMFDDEDENEFERLNREYGAEAAILGIDPREVESMYSHRSKNNQEEFDTSMDDMELDEEMDDGSETVPSFSPSRDMDTGEDLAPSFDSDGNFLGMVKPNRYDMELDEDEDLNYLKNDLEENEIETPVRPGIKTPTKPKKPGTPYSPKPGPKKNPKAKKGDMPDWLSFDELGINFE